MKKIMAFALAMVMLFGMSACGSEPVETEPSTVPTSEATEPVSTTAPVEETTAPTETEPVETTVPETEAPTEPSEPAPTKPKGNGGNSGNQGNGSNHGDKPKPTEPADKSDPDEWLNTEPTDPPHTHSYTTTVVKPTCESKGYTEYKCACGYSYTADEVNPTGHTWGGWVVIKEASFGHDGERMQECKECSKRRSEKIPAEIAPSEPKPTEPETEPTEPTPTKPVPTEPTEPAPTKPTEPPHEHKYTKNVVKPTCENKGYTEYKCACGDSYTADEKDATGHKWDNGKVTVKPTTEAEGEKTFTCKVCGKTRKEVLPKEEKPKQEVIDVAAIEAYGRSYAASIGFIVDTSLGFGNAGYLPGGTECVVTMQKGYSYIVGYTAATKNKLMAAVGSIEGARYNCKVEYDHTDAAGNQWYTFWVFYG